MPWQRHAVLYGDVPRSSGSSHLTQKVSGCVHCASRRLHAQELRPKPVLFVAAQSVTYL